jgi:hypothetical protein
LNKQLAEIDVDKLQALLKRELKRHAERSPKSQALLVNAKKVMPSGVPMAWMSGFYEAPPVFVAKGEGAYFEELSDRAKALADKLKDMQQKGTDPAAKALDQARQEAQKAAEQMAQMKPPEGEGKVSPPKVVEGPQSPSENPGSEDGGQGTKGGGSNTGAGSSKKPSPPNNNENHTIGPAGQPSSAKLTPEGLMAGKSTSKSPGGHGTEITDEAKKMLAEGFPLPEGGDPEAKGSGGLGGGPMDPEAMAAAAQAQMAAASAMTEAAESLSDLAQGMQAQMALADALQQAMAAEMASDQMAMSDSASAASESLSEAAMAAAESAGSPSQQGQGQGKGQGKNGGGIKSGKRGRSLPHNLRDYGISVAGWNRLPGRLQNRILQAEADGAPEQYRGMVQRYFHELARRGSSTKEKSE